MSNRVRKYPCGYPGCHWIFTRTNHVQRHHERVHPGYKGPIVPINPLEQPVFMPMPRRMGRRKKNADDPKLVAAKPIVNTYTRTNESGQRFGFVGKDIEQMPGGSTVGINRIDHDFIGGLESVTGKNFSAADHAKVTTVTLVTKDPNRKSTIVSIDTGVNYRQDEVMRPRNAVIGGKVVNSNGQGVKTIVIGNECGKKKSKKKAPNLARFRDPFTNGYQCDLGVCGEWFRSRGELNSHLYQKHSVIEAEVCLKVDGEDDAQNRLQPASSAAGSLTYVDSENNHRNNHQAYFSSLTATTPKKLGYRYFCDAAGCDKSYAKNSDLNRHRKLHHQLGDNEGSTSTGRSMNIVRPYLCSIFDCRKSYTTKSHLIRHMVAVHKIPKPVPRSDQLNSILSRYAKVSSRPAPASMASEELTKDRPYACTHLGCGWRFKRLYHLTRHQLTHDASKSKSVNAASLAALNALKYDANNVTIVNIDCGANRIGGEKSNLDLNEHLHHQQQQQHQQQSQPQSQSQAQQQQPQQHPQPQHTQLQLHLHPPIHHPLLMASMACDLRCDQQGCGQSFTDDQSLIQHLARFHNSVDYLSHQQASQQQPTMVSYAEQQVKAVAVAAAQFLPPVECVLSDFGGAGGECH